MIFVTVGTNEAPFDRLLRAVDALPRGEPLIVQHGSSSVRPRSATLVEFLPFEELLRHVGAARVVVTHAGVGSVSVALRAGRRPVVVPRLHRYGEAVDDHQLPFARRLAASGLATLVEDTELLAAAVALDSVCAPAADAAPPELAAELRSYILDVVAAHHSGAAM